MAAKDGWVVSAGLSVVDQQLKGCVGRISY